MAHIALKIWSSQREKHWRQGIFIIVRFFQESLLNSNSNVNLFSLIEDSIALAVDTGISDIIITGDFNLIMLSQQTSRKIDTVSETYSLSKIITEPTHFTEPSSSLIDLLVVSNKDHVLLSAVGDPFLTQQVRYHCPICGIFKFSKPKKKTKNEADKHDYINS